MLAAPHATGNRDLCDATMPRQESSIMTTQRLVVHKPPHPPPVQRTHSLSCANCLCAPASCASQLCCWCVFVDSKGVLKRLLRKGGSMPQLRRSTPRYTFQTASNLTHIFFEPSAMMDFTHKLRTFLARQELSSCFLCRLIPRDRHTHGVIPVRLMPSPCTCRMLSAVY